MTKQQHSSSQQQQQQQHSSSPLATTIFTTAKILHRNTSRSAWRDVSAREDFPSLAAAMTQPETSKKKGQKGKKQNKKGIDITKLSGFH